MSEYPNRYGPGKPGSGEPKESDSDHTSTGRTEPRDWFEARCPDCGEQGRCTYKDGRAICATCLFDSEAYDRE